MDMRSKIVAGSASALVLAPGFALAQQATEPDYSAITGAVNYSGIATGILAIAALGVVVMLAWKGANLLLAQVKRG